MASVFFGSDAANPDNYPHFYADLQMYNVSPAAPDPAWFMRAFLSSEVASRANKWQGRNVTRWRNDEYDRLYEAADAELDPVKRAALFIKMNDLLIQHVVVIPVLWRNGVSASSLTAPGYGSLGLGYHLLASCRTGTRRNSPPPGMKTPSEVMTAAGRSGRGQACPRPLAGRRGFSHPYRPRSGRRGRLPAKTDRLRWGWLYADLGR